MTLEEILKLDISDKNVCIVGPPASGKTWLSNQIGNGTHRKIHVDDYKMMGFEQAPYTAIDTANSSETPYLIEGVQCYRALRSGLEFGNFRPSVIIQCDRAKVKREETYLQERDPNKLKHIRKFELGLLKIWAQYLIELPKSNSPELIIWENIF